MTLDDVDDMCAPVPGGQKITWWNSCERRDCEEYPVTTLEDLRAGRREPRRGAQIVDLKKQEGSFREG